MGEQRPIPLGYEKKKKKKKRTSQLWFIVHSSVVFIDKKLISMTKYVMRVVRIFLMYGSILCSNQFHLVGYHSGLWLIPKFSINKMHLICTSFIVLPPTKNNPLTNLDLKTICL